MSVTDTCTTPVNRQTDRLREAFADPDLLGMVYAETYRSRRDHLPHRAARACLLDREEAGCDGLCSLAITLVIEDLVAYYGRQLARGRIGELDNPGGYARTIVRCRHRDVVRSLTIPEGGYHRPERLADAAAQPAYLGLSDEADGLLVSAAMHYLRSGRTRTTWSAVCEHAESVGRRRGAALAPGEARTRLDRFVARALATGGRAEAFVRRELLDLLDARSVSVTDDIERHAARSAAAGRNADDQLSHALDARALADLLTELDRTLAGDGGWEGAPRRARYRAVRRRFGLPDQDRAVQELVAAVEELWGGHSRGVPLAGTVGP